MSFHLAYAHVIADSILGCSAAVVTVHPLLHSFLIRAVHRRRIHTDTAMIAVVVRTHEIMQHVDVADRLVLREIIPHTRRYGPVETLHNARLRFLVVLHKVMHAILFQ